MKGGREKKREERKRACEGRGGRECERKEEGRVAMKNNNHHQTLVSPSLSISLSRSVTHSHKLITIQGDEEKNKKSQGRNDKQTNEWKMSFQDVLDLLRDFNLIKFMNLFRPKNIYEFIDYFFLHPSFIVYIKDERFLFIPKKFYN